MRATYLLLFALLVAVPASAQAPPATEDTQVNVLSAVTAAANSLSNIEGALAAESTHGNAVIATGPGVQGEAKDIDGGALPNVVTEGQSARLALTLSGAALTTLVNEAGTADIGASILTALELIDDPVFVDDAAFTPGTSKGFAVGGQADDTSTDSVDEGDFGAFRISLDRLLYVRFVDPCSGVAKTFLPVNISTATTTEITPSLAGASNNYYICSINLVTAAANNVALVDDDTDNCASVTSGLAGGTTAASGWNFAANGGEINQGGNATVAKTNGTNRVVCLVTSAATQLSGTIAVVAAP